MMINTKVRFMKNIIIVVVAVFGLISCNPKIETTAFINPVMWADVPDMSITRNGDNFYLISTTMHLMPGDRKSVV